MIEYTDEEKKEYFGLNTDPESEKLLRTEKKKIYRYMIPGFLYCFRNINTASSLGHRRGAGDAAS